MNNVATLRAMLDECARQIRGAPHLKRRELKRQTAALTAALDRLERPSRSRMRDLESMIRRLIPWAAAGGMGRTPPAEVKEAKKLLGPRVRP